MTIGNRVNYISKHISKIGLLQSVSYFIQRIFVAKGKYISINLLGLSHPIYLRSKTYDTNIFYQIFINEELGIKFENEINTILDLGGNIGLATLFLLRKFPLATFVTVEPENYNFKVLLKNTCNYKNIQCLKAGVFSKNCNLFLVDLEEGEASYQIVEDPKSFKILDKINCVNIDFIKEKFNLKKIDLIKMDIEGSEEACILDTPIEWINSTTYLMVEIHESFKAGLTEAIKSAIPISFKVFQHGEYWVFHNSKNSITSF